MIWGDALYIIKSLRRRHHFNQFLKNNKKIIFDIKVERVRAKRTSNINMIILVAFM